MTKFEKKSFLEIMQLEQKELEKYYLELRKYNYEQNIPLKNIKLRNKIHNLLLSIVKLDRLLSKEKIVVIKDERINTNSPKIYACTHIGGKDIERSFEAIKDHCYLFFGDPGEVYRNYVGLLLHLNGVIYLETLKKLKQIDNFNIPVVALTADAMGGKFTKYIEVGFSDYLSKPINKEELKRVLYKCLNVTIETLEEKTIEEDSDVHRVIPITDKDIEMLNKLLKDETS